MTFGHYSISFAAKAVARTVPLWVYFLAAQWLDICWSILVLLGIEKVQIVPGLIEAHAIDHYYMPYSHSLPGAIALSAVFGGLVASTVAEKRSAAFGVVSAASLSHWVLDFLVHVPDLPLYGNTAKVGLGLWRYVSISFPLELILLIAGAWIYARAVPTTSARGRNMLWVFVALLAAMQVYTAFGPPPDSETTMAITGLGFYVVLAALAAWVERIRLRPDRGLGHTPRSGGHLPVS